MSAQQLEPTLVKCKGCGQKIAFVARPNGKTIPLQPVRRVYEIDHGVARESSLVGVWVSHFETCPKASEFSRQVK